MPHRILVGNAHPTPELASTGAILYDLAPLAREVKRSRLVTWFRGAHRWLRPPLAMSLTRNKLVGAVAACAWLCTNSGCSVPWATPFSRHVESPAAPTATINRAADGEPLRSASASRTELEAPRTPADEAPEPDLSGVLDKLEQVRAIDPAAEQQLIAKLRDTPSDSWPSGGRAVSSFTRLPRATCIETATAAKQCSSHRFCGTR